MPRSELDHQRELEGRFERHAVYRHLFVLPLAGLVVAVLLLPASCLLLPPAGGLFCYLQARHLRLPSPGWWIVWGAVLNILAMVYLLGYAHGAGLPEREAGGRWPRSPPSAGPP